MPYPYSTMKRLVAFVLTGIVLLVSILPVCAMDFNAEEIYESIFVIQTDKSVGSGFALGKNCVVTNYHVIEGAYSVKMQTYDGHVYSAKPFEYDKKKDIAILYVQDIELKPLKIADEKSVKIGDDIYTVGAPGKMAYTLTKGVISAKDRVLSGQPYYQIDAAINPGNSGGPLLNAKGEVLGMNTLKSVDNEGIGFSIPIHIVMDFLSENGVWTDEESHAEITEPQSTEAETSSESESGSTKPYIEETKTEDNSILKLALVVSVLLNIVLIICICFSKKKSKVKNNMNYVPDDPSERTDFEIEIEE